MHIIIAVVITERMTVVQRDILSGKFTCLLSVSCVSHSAECLVRRCQLCNLFLLVLAMPALCAVCLYRVTKDCERSTNIYMCVLQDVENYDPILNPVLNRELRRTGGRVLITLGDQDIDLSPSFVIFLSTRDPTVEFPPDICSRVTFVNFTVTRSSLQSQCLNQVLKAERPDIDEKRSDLLKLQGMCYAYVIDNFC